MRKLLTIVLMMFVLSGCNDSKPAGDDGKIGFASQMTRALINNAEDLQQQELRLCGACGHLYDNMRYYRPTSLAPRRGYIRCE